MSNINIFTDGASRGNPGFAGIGVAIYSDGVLIDQISAFLGNKTNNEAEYTAVIRAFERLKDLKKSLNPEKVNLFSDSQFLVKQLKGEYKVKAEKIIPLFKKVQEEIKKLDLNITFNWIRREDNKLADSLANKGIDEKNKKKSLDLNLNSNSNKNLVKNSSENVLKLDRAFFGKINCLKIQMNLQNEIYFHIGLVNSKTKVWRWIKVKMNDSELGEIVNLLKKDIGKCSFFHSFGNLKTQIWCNKSNDSFSIKIKDISKNLSVGELEVLRIILEKAIILKNFGNSE